MLLLPSMIREAVGTDRLDYQIAPGIAESSSVQLLALELEVPRVTYLLDGDAGGGQHAKRLHAANVPSNRIVHLGGPGSGMTTEDLLREDVYLSAVNEVLERVHGQAHGHIKASDLSTPNRSKSVDKWCVARGISPLSKPVVASVLLEQAPTTLLTQSSRSALKAVHRNLCAALDLPTAV